MWNTSALHACFASRHICPLEQPASHIHITKTLTDTLRGRLLLYYRCRTSHPGLCILPYCNTHRFTVSLRIYLVSNIKQGILYFVYFVFCALSGTGGLTHHFKQIALLRQVGRFEATVVRLGQQHAVPRLQRRLVVPHAGRDHLELRESLPSGPPATATL